MFQFFVSRLSHFAMGPITSGTQTNRYDQDLVIALPNPLFGPLAQGVTPSLPVSSALERVKANGKVMVPFGLFSAQLATALFSNPQLNTGDVAGAEGVAGYNWIEYDRALLPFPGEYHELSVDTVPCICQSNDGKQCLKSYEKDETEECVCTRGDRFEIHWFPPNNSSLNRSRECGVGFCFHRPPRPAEEDGDEKECARDFLINKDEADKREDYMDLKLLARDCSAIRGTVQLLTVMMNSTNRRFDCVTMARKRVQGRYAIDEEIYKGFANSPEHSSTIPGIVHAFDFKESKDDTLRLTLMHNTSGITADFFGIFVQWRPWQSRLTTTLNLVLRAFVAERTGKSELEMSPLLLGLKAFPVTPPWGQGFDLGSIMGPFLFSISFLIIFPGLVSELVQEKNARTRIMMKMMGLGTSAYWSISFAFWFLVYMCFSLVFMMFVNLVALPSGYKLGMFRNVLGGVQFIFFLLFAQVNIAFAFLWSTLTSNLRTVQVLTIMWVVCTTTLIYILDIVGGIFTSTGFPRAFLTFLSLFPPFALFRGLAVFRAYKVHV